ncbi:MAG TPA: hypothetical protein VMJ10_19365 [Kofleriaceae bacterium]|nr:hypothetical protein [Kofleriaceae bacterium]
MKHAIWCLALVWACGKSGEEQAKEDMARRAAEEAKLQAETAPPPKVVQEAPAPVAAPKPAAPPAPEPTTPAELDKAFKQAMIDGRDKDVLHYCEMLKLDDTSNPQSLMGCTLAACRTNDADTAKRYAASLPKSKDGAALLVQAKKVCLANKVGL